MGHKEAPSDTTDALAVLTDRLNSLIPGTELTQLGYSVGNGERMTGGADQKRTHRFSRLAVGASGICLGLTAVLVADRYDPDWYSIFNTAQSTVKDKFRPAAAPTASPQLNCSDVIASVIVGSTVGLQGNYRWVTDPAEWSKVAQDSTYVPKHTVNTFDPKAQPPYSDPSAQTIQLPPLPSLSDLSSGKVDAYTMPSGEVPRNRSGFLSGTLHIMACPNTPESYIQTNSDGSVSLDPSKIQLTVKLPGVSSTNLGDEGSKFTTWYDSQFLRPVPGTNEKMITDRDLERINTVLVPEAGQSNKGITNEIIGAVLNELDTEPCRTGLTSAVKDGVTSWLEDLSGGKRDVTFKPGSFIMPGEAWKNGHSDEDYEPDIRPISTQILCTNPSEWKD